MKTLLIATVAMTLTCCGQKAKVIQTGGSSSITSVSEVDIQDIQNAAITLLDSMMGTGVLQRGENYPARIVIENVKNDTSSRFDIDELLYRMRAKLVNSGQAVIVSTWGDNAESKEAKKELDMENFLEGKTTTRKMLSPDFSLTGKITDTRRVAGNVKQYTYTFRLTLTDMNTGLEAWTDWHDVTKQGSKPSIGF